MTAIESNPISEPQTPGQWAVRWFALAAVALLCASVPVVHLLWHGVLGHDEPPIRTRAQTEVPAADVDEVLSGRWMSATERALQERSPIVWSLRGHWNELRYRLGVPRSERVHFGRDGWLFLGNTVRVPLDDFDRASERRRAFFAQVRDRLRAAGVELLVSIVPDKMRVYPQFAFADGVVPPRRDAAYATLQQELAELQIAAVDLATPMRAMAAATVDGDAKAQLYFARDTHWRPGGALVAGQAVAAAVEQRFGASLSPRVPMALTGPSHARAVGDITDMLGMLTMSRRRTEDKDRMVAMSMLTDSLAEQRDYYGLEVRGPGAATPMFGQDATAEVWLTGTSFAEANGMVAVSFALGRPVYGIIERGAPGIAPMQAALREIEAGARPKVVVWEIVERGFFTGQWLEPPLRR
ncbi:MAG: alginate O-acetyltransferase AlgX-related protein [Planctomycetota bacterium]